MTNLHPEPPQQFLILHKVRGEAAFDIAHKITVIDEERWVCSTSGARAYPIWWQPLDELWFEIGIGYTEGRLSPVEQEKRYAPNVIEALPEHDLFWQVKSDGLWGATKSKMTLTLASLGLATQRPITRRKL